MILSCLCLYIVDFAFSKKSFSAFAEFGLISLCHSKIVFLDFYLDNNLELLNKHLSPSDLDAIFLRNLVYQLTLFSFLLIVFF